MEMHQVRYFLAVARTLNFTKAADECHVAQPSLSRAIQKLEEELGGDLFRRERNHTHLTELGRTMQPVLARCYAAAEEARALGTAFKRGRTAVTIRVALSHTVSLQLVVGARTEVGKALPGVDLRFERGSATEVAQSLKDGGTELGVACPIGEQWDRLDAWLLFEEGFRLAVGNEHPLADRDAVTQQDLGDLQLIARPYCEQAEALARIIARDETGSNFTDIVTSDRDALDLVAGNAGVATYRPARRPPAAFDTS